MKNKLFFLPFFFALSTFSNILSNNKELILKLNQIGAIKMEPVTLEGGIVSPFYFDMRLIISHPEILQELTNKVKQKIVNINYDLVCGVPYAAVPIATLVSASSNTPMIMQRREVKSYGTRKMIEGKFAPQNSCLIIEDVIVTGKSIKNTALVLKEHDLIVKDIVILVDREQGGVESLEKNGYRVHTIIKLSEVLEVLFDENIIDQKQIDCIKDFCKQNRV